MYFGRPTVEIVILRAEMPKAQRAEIVRIASVTALKFERGSPMHP